MTRPIKITGRKR